MLSTECWFRQHENCSAVQWCECECHADNYDWDDADRREFT